MALSDLVAATLVVARAGHAGLLDNGTGQARPLRSLFPALPQTRSRGGNSQRLEDRVLHDQRIAQRKLRD